MNGAATERNGRAAEAETIDLIQSLRCEWLKLPLAAMRDVGPAAQTLAGLLKITRRETFTKISEIAIRARVPTATARKHLVTLAERGWIENVGRQHTPGGRPRRTCTLKITKQTRDAMGEYAVLPWWACCRTRKGRLSWSSRAVLAVVMSQLMKLAAVVEREVDGAISSDEVWEGIANLGDCERFQFSVAKLCKITGLSRQAAIDAKRDLHRRGIIQLISDRPNDGSDVADMLQPRAEFCVRVTPAREGRCFVEF